MPINPMPGKKLYIPDSAKPFSISRTKIDLFLQCPRCFYLDRRHGVARPSGPPFTLNVAVDSLLKKEFDACRKKGVRHPVMEQYQIDAVPAQHEKLSEWRRNFVGVRSLHEETNLLVFGAIDDLWLSSSGWYHVVDYKATAKAEAITALDQPWHRGYKQQAEVYQWLLRRNGLSVSDRAYFLYCNGRIGLEGFEGRLEFDLTIIPYEGNDAWIEDALREMKACLDAGNPPVPAKGCEFCRYVGAALQITGH